VLQRALAQQSRSKESKFKSDRLGMHVLHCDSSDERIVRFMLLNLYASSDKRNTCASLKPIPKNLQD